ncbi:hypothetical protein KBZ21_55090, partial [Streptomyces sp. A73]|nr:hypothetical protein [Streptomyces sp. A73]
SGRGKVRYDLNELPLAVRDEYTREVLWHEDTPPMPESAPRAASTGCSSPPLLSPAVAAPTRARGGHQPT